MLFSLLKCLFLMPLRQRDREREWFPSDTGDLLPCPCDRGCYSNNILYETTLFSALHKLGSTDVSQEKEQAVDEKAVSKPVFQLNFSEPCLNTNVCKTH